MVAEKKKQKGILDYIFQFAGEYKGAYIKSVVYAVIGVAFSLAPYIIMEAAGMKIAFVGVTTPKTITSSTPKYFQDENGNLARKGRF